MEVRHLDIHIQSIALHVRLAYAFSGLAAENNKVKKTDVCFERCEALH